MTTLREEEYPLTGDGHSASFTPALTLGAGINGVPIEIALFANFGYRSWNSQRNMRFEDGTSGPVGLRTQEPYFGLWGFEMRFPSVPCEATSPIRFERFGLAAFGEPQNVLGYFTVSANYAANHRYRLRTLLTPQISNFGSELNTGGELVPIETTFYLRHGFISFAPGARIEYNFATSSPVLEAFGELRYFPAHEFGIAARAGWIGDISGHQLLEGEPSTPFGSLNFIFNFDSPGNSAYRPEIARSTHGR
jgi:hypothetical protein